ncbi:response regulator [Pseudoxanthomonas dokdonensis]|uniref:Chemotaxis protein CheY n=1 Tax=Pseudoxanthomonas dokdonensis TaxID=344882 RepID=A0A0R0CKA0_9GAMM|nr:response regulator [Pseudoxanthomonas dokdonensis]KRG70409.1 chemotaxis protein CheY [Pseudoxanthomonas dokdonensis]
MAEAIRLLLVEDEELLRMMIGDALADMGFQVATAEDGNQALPMLAEQTFDVIISDISMPGGVSGITLAEEAARQQPQARFILSSGYARAQLPPIPEGALFLPKPYRIPQLLALIDGAGETPAV